MSGTMASLAVRRATNMFGPVGADIRDRLDAVIANPTEATWEDAHSIILNRKTYRTLWQAVIRIDPEFPRTGPVTDGQGNQVTGWTAVPSRETLLAAITASV